MPPRFNPRFDSINPEDTAGLPDVDFSNIDFNDPASVFKAIGGGHGSNLPIPDLVSPAKVRADSTTMARKIFADWELLNLLLDKHEPTIHKRWAKKTKNQRTEILLKAWPAMSASHRPDFAAFKRESMSQRQSGTRFREAYLWPFVNLEDLSKPKNLLLFLQSRARNPPDAFAMSDENSPNLGYVTKSVVPLFLNEHTMMFTDRKTPQRYGELIAWDDDDRAFEWMNSRRGMLPGSGLLVLEIQQRVMRFLVDCCKLVMHDIPEERLTSDDFPTQPSMTMDRAPPAGFTSLAGLAAETPYRSPADMDLERLEFLFSARVAAAEDHVWQMREDPAYFSDCLLEYKEHRQEIIIDSNGREHPVFTQQRPEVFWRRILGNVLVQSYIQFEMWTELLQQVRRLRELQKKYSKSISRDRDLPDAYLNALLKFRYWLEKTAVEGPMHYLKTAAPASPNLRPYFTRDPPPNPTTTMIGCRSKPNLKFDKPQGELFWILKTLMENERHLFLVGLTTIVDELGRLLDTEPTAKAMVSTYIGEVLGDLGILTEGLRQIENYQPWAQTFETVMADKQSEIEKERKACHAKWGPLLGAIDGTDGVKVVQLAIPDEGRFNYPVAKRRTRENVELMRAAEANLDAFWAAADVNMKKQAGGRLAATATIQLLSQARSLHRTEEWVEPAKKTNDEAPITKVSFIEQPLSQLYIDHDRKTPSTTGRHILKAPTTTTTTPKPKTKGPTIPTPTPNHPPPPSPPPSPLPIHVDARALRTLQTLFYHPTASTTPGEIPWPDFLHTMLATGFSAEKLYGSVWNFRPVGEAALGRGAERGFSFMSRMGLRGGRWGGGGRGGGAEGWRGRMGGRGGCLC